MNTTVFVDVDTGDDTGKLIWKYLPNNYQSNNHRSMQIKTGDFVFKRGQY